MLLHGIGGVGKSTLAAEVLKRLLEEGRPIVDVVGPTDPEAILEAVGKKLLSAAVADDLPEKHPLRTVATNTRRPDLPWSDRLEVLADQLFPHLPLVLLLDNFEDNLRRTDTGWEPASEAMGGFLTAWLARPGRSRLLVTSRYPFPLPEDAHERLEPLHVGPLSLAETRKLMWRLPRLDALSPEDQQRAWATVGGHPRTLEYLDALLAGEAKFREVQKKMERVLRRRRAVEDPEAWIRGAERDLDQALAEAVTLAVDDVLLGDLLERLEDLPLARRLLLGASVYRLPVDDVGLAWQVSERVEPDPQRVARTRDFDQRRRKARGRDEEPSGESLGYSEEEWRQVQRDLEEWRKPPLAVPAAELAEAAGRLQELGLLAPVSFGQGRLWAIHRWTARALAQIEEGEALREAHRRAAEHWQWRVEVAPQSREADLEQLLEARHHALEAEDLDRAIELSGEAAQRMETAGEYAREVRLLHETLAWLDDRPADRAAYLHQLGIVAQLRGDYDGAPDWYRKSLAIEEELGNRSGMASTISQIGVLATQTGQSEAGVPSNLRSLAIWLEIGSPEAAIDLRWLARQRRELGEERFVAVLSEHLDDDSRPKVLELLRRFEESQAGG